MIYCVEDERNIRELIVYTLNNSGFTAQGFETGKELMVQIKKELPELILLDIMLPDEDGISILQRLKKVPDTRDIPVIMVTAKGAEYDRVMGLDQGADDYIVKPFGMMEFLARVRALLRRTKMSVGMNTETLQYERLRIDISKHQVWLDEEKVPLTLKEFEVLRYLLENQGRVITRDRMLEQIWGYEFDGETRTVDVHIRTLRQKLGDIGYYIETVRGIGYRIGGME